MEHQLIELSRYENDPVAFVGYAFPWSEKNTALEKFDGPETWQLRVLCHIRDRLLAGAGRHEAISEAIRTAVASGHGVGKSALVSMIIIWAISTMIDTRGVVTANTETQLKTKTWAELGKWYNLFLHREFFELTATAIFFKGRERTWRIDMVPWTIQKTEAFAGLHNQGKRVLLIMDEASAIDDKIWEVAEGALTDASTQILWCVFGNPTRNVGRFKDCFESYRDRWWREQVDSRSVSFTNKPQIETWSKDYGDDSDWFRIRIRGVFPRTGEMEFISSADVKEAMLRDFVIMRTDPLVIGVDVARYGANESVIFFRKGRDARSIPPVRLRGVSTVELAQKVMEVYQRYHVDAIFIDGGGVGGGVVDNCRALHLYCYDIQFGAKPDLIGFATGTDGERYANKRAEMWGAMRSWLKGGAIPDIPDLRSQLIGPTYTFNLQNAILLEKKEDMMKRGIASPDLADALALTFAMPVANHEHAGGELPQKPLVQSEYNPFAEERMIA
jgi:hypothetical protein